MKNIDKIRAMSAEELAEKLLPPHCECEYCIINAECNHICGNCYGKIAEWLNQEANPMPEIKVGDIVDTIYYALVAIDHNVFVRSATREKMELNDAGKIERIWRFNSEGEYEMIWRADK